MKRSDIKKQTGQEIGVLFGTVFLIIGLYPVVNDSPVFIESLYVSLFLLVLAVLKPGLLAPLYTLWMKLAHILGLVVTPVVMGLLFLVIFVPMALLLKLFKKDILRIGPSWKNNHKTYWRPRSKELPCDMNKQF